MSTIADQDDRRRKAVLGGRPEIPNEHWLAGEQACREGVPRSPCPFVYPGSRWEWEAGWDHADALVAPWPTCAECEERHAPGYDCKTYAPRCWDCRHLGDRRFRFSRPGVLRDVLAPSLGPDALECSECESVNIRLEVVA